jgi:hypothetical protein
MKVLLSLLTFVSLTVQAANPTPIVEDDFPWMNDEVYKKEKIYAKERSQRSIASSGQVNDQLLSAEFKASRTKFLSIQTAKDLKAYIVDLNSKYEQLPDDLKLMTAMMTPLLTFQAFTFKVYPYLSKEKITHSLLLTGVQNFAAFMSMNLPSANWKAGFEFVTSPSSEEDLERFNSAADLQNYLVKKVFPAYSLAARRVAKLNLAKKPLVWDNKIFFGTGSFSDNFARYQLIGEGERYMILANIHFTLADICRFSSYDLNDFLPLVKDLGMLYGYDSAISPVDGVSAKKIASVYRHKKFAKLLTLRHNGDKNMASALKFMREGSRNLQLAWTELRDRNDDNQSFIRAAIFTPFTQIIDSQVESLEQVISGKTTVRSDVTGEMVAVDVPSFYQNPPKDLKELLPVGFDNSRNFRKYSIAMKNGKNQNVDFRNYFSGRATEWNASAYKTLLPEITKGSDVAPAMKILNQSISGTIPAMMIQPFMLY